MCPLVGSRRPPRVWLKGAQRSAWPTERRASGWDLPGKAGRSAPTSRATQCEVPQGREKGGSKERGHRGKCKTGRETGGNEVYLVRLRFILEKEVDSFLCRRLLVGPGEGERKAEVKIGLCFCGRANISEEGPGGPPPQLLDLVTREAGGRGLRRRTDPQGVGIENTWEPEGLDHTFLAGL